MAFKIPVLGKSVAALSENDRATLATSRREAHAPALLGEKAFLKALCLERRRAERSRKPLLLTLIQEANSTSRPASGRFMRTILETDPAVAATVRETDTRGWYQEFSAYGLIFTEFNDTPRPAVQHRISQRISTVLGESVPSEQLKHWEVSFHFYPEDESGVDRTAQPNRSLYPDLTAREDAAKFSRSIKRFIDLVGSALGIVLLSPVLAAIGLAVKLNSRGPVFFKQTRVGQYGARFTLLKFRSMATASDSRIHEDYVKGYIRGREGTKQTASGNQAYKLTQDPRITKMGRFLRKTSLDELPQLFNVLMGNMSLVGPRPPIPYELEAYDLWHMRRLLEARPGITGLWQVMGRSRTTFDEMVRLDLRYAKTWSLWLDIKILLRTPRAVVSGNGAY